MTQIERQTVNLALGRIFGMMQRPERSGDVAKYTRCRNLILDLTEGHYDLTDRRPDYQRDRMKGAQGD